MEGWWVGGFGVEVGEIVGGGGGEEGDVGTGWARAWAWGWSWTVDEVGIVVLVVIVAVVPDWGSDLSLDLDLLVVDERRMGLPGMVMVF